MADHTDALSVTLLLNKMASCLSSVSSSICEATVFQSGEGVFLYSRLVLLTSGCPSISLFLSSEWFPHLPFFPTVHMTVFSVRHLSAMLS